MLLPNDEKEDFFNNVQALIDQARYNEAIAVLESQAQVWEAAEDWEAYSKCLIKQSECNWRDGKYPEGAAIAEKGLAVCLGKLGELHEHSASSYNSLGICHMLSCQYDDALQHLQKSLEIRLQIWGETSYYVGVSLMGMGNLLASMQHYVQAIEHHLRAYTIFKQIQPAPRHFLGMSAINLGVCYVEVGQYDKGLTYYLEAKTEYEAVFGEYNAYTAFLYNNLSVVYAEMGDFSQTLYYAQKSLDIKMKILHVQHPDILISIFGLGRAYNFTGDYAHAFLYYNKALKLAHLVANNEVIVKIHQNLAVGYYNMYDYAKAIEHLNLAVNLQLTHFGEINVQMEQLCYNLAINYRALNRQEQALAYYHRALQILTELPFSQYHDLSLCYMGIGNCLLDNGNYTEAIRQYEQAALTFVRVFGNAHPAIATLYCHLADCFTRQEQYEQALLYLQKSMAALGLQAAEQNFYPVPPLQNYNSATELLHTLSDKGRVLGLLYRQNRQPACLAAAIAHIESAADLTDQIRLLYKAEGSIHALSDLAKTKVYDVALELLWLAETELAGNPAHGLQVPGNTLDYVLPQDPMQTVFRFSEKSKAALLFAAITDAKARFDAQLPSDLLEQEYNLRLQLTYLEQRIAEEAYIEPQERLHDEWAAWHEQYYDLKQAYLALIEKMETEYPYYYQLKYDCKTASVTAIQAALPPDTALLSYTPGAKYLYIFVLTATAANWVQYPLPEGFEGLVDDFCESFEPLSDEYFLTGSYDMYRHLLAPIAHLLPNITRLIIIPEGSLTKVPFEALLTQPCEIETPQAELPFLLQQYTITYHYSATLWLYGQTHNQTHPHSQPPAHDFIGFAPVYSPGIETPATLFGLTPEEMETEEDMPVPAKRISYAHLDGVLRAKVEGTDYVELPYSEKEVNRVKELFDQYQKKTDALLHEKANLNAFKTLAGNCRYLLVAAHADYIDAQPEKTGIVFAPNSTDGKGILYVSDSFNLRLQAELVALSCCETGLGKMVKGEGVMALNRGFLFSGAKNVVYTLFKVYDQASQELVAALFTAILQGQPPAQALCRAKRSLIAKGYKHYMWAGYVLVGESIG